MSIININGEEYIKVSDAVTSKQFGKQVNTVLSYIGNDTLQTLKECEAIIAGGAILSAFTKTTPNDIDIYFRSEEQMKKAFLELTHDYENYYICHSDKSVTIVDSQTNKTLQFIIFEYFSDAKAVFNAFDFTICMGAIDCKDIDQGIIFDKDFINDVASRTLRFNDGTRFPYNSLVRTMKYQEKGYTIGKGQMMYIALACANLGVMETWDDVKKQLGGFYGGYVELGYTTTQKECTYKNIAESILETSSYHVGGTVTDYEEIYEKITGNKFEGYSR